MNGEFTKTGYESNPMNSTINRQTILSKMTKDQSNQATKDLRHLSRYRQFQDLWEKESNKIRHSTQRK